MYSRQNADVRSSRNGLRIPSNYSGNAFFTQADTRQSNSESESISNDAENSVASDTADAAVSAEPSLSVTQSGISRLLGKGQSGGIGLEELLILGIILLISQNDAKDDLAFLLMLLLFIK